MPTTVVNAVRRLCHIVTAWCGAPQTDGGGAASAREARTSRRAVPAARKHLLAVREVGMQSVEAARARGDECCFDDGENGHRFRVSGGWLVSDAVQVASVLRRQTLLALSGCDPTLRGSQVAVAFTTLAELVEQGPFEPIFWRPGVATPADLIGSGR